MVVTLRYFTEFDIFWGQITLKWLKLDPYYLLQKYRPSQRI